MQVKLIIFLVLALLINGCAHIGPSYGVYVDSITAPGSDSKTKYILLPNNKDTSSDDLQYLEYKPYLVRALKSNGYREVNSIDDADIAVFVGYGIGDPQTEQHTYSVPTWGQTGVSSSRTYGTFNSYGNTSSYSGTTIYTPTYGITGSETKIRTKTTYFRFISLVAYDVNEYKKSKKMKQVWKTDITSSGSSGDLRRAFPVLVAASEPYIGKDTNKKVHIKIRENDDSVNKLKGISVKSNQ
ncbi:hypothetical protein VQ7734_00144 [Vibrio quintilis]|uniref:DUF4136 domain-containing protein n=2 Tax=Vibrio quintilis TaxID=1117707 RepID=A0A1M7YP68_9VIBR|nr:hypothetical protein VQ7734_00144 [Vibrio quintilis]